MIQCYYGSKEVIELSFYKARQPDWTSSCWYFVVATTTGSTNTGSWYYYRTGTLMATPQVITELGPDDVLFGRGAPIVQTTGNVRFRDIVNANKAAYASTRCRQTKDSIARDIINAIDERGGKFLKEIKSSDDARKYDVPAGMKAWIVAEYDEIVEKVKQTLRETEKSTVEKEAESNLKVRCVQPASTLTEGPRRSDQPLDDGFFPVIPQSHHGAIPVSSSLLPLVQQQLVTMQNNQRRYHMQQELAMTLQQYQNQVLAASIGTAATTGGMTPNALPVSHQLSSLGLGSSIPAPMSIEDYLFALHGGSTETLPGMVGTGTNNPPLLSTIPSNPYFSSTPSSSTLSLMNHSSQNAIDQILQRDAVLTALRRHRQQIEDGFHQGPSSRLGNAGTTQNNNDIPLTEVVSVANIASSRSNCGDPINNTSTICNVSRLEEIASSLLSQYMDDPTRLLSQMSRPSIPTIPDRSSVESTNHVLKSVPLSDDIVRSGNERKKKNTTTIMTTTTTDTEDESMTPVSKKKRRDK